ncbi:MAG TPA: ABC transporter ATP-binding protein, partial [Chloroflexia bacterium]|nr:ABC transporter ATP-binding protein [Chloroflexia bacterium]
MSGYGMVALDRVTVKYGSELAVNGVSAIVRRGEWVGLIGPNGAGKTSLLRAIAQLERAEGTICVNGEVMGRLAHRRRAQLVAYVPQQPEFPAEMAVLDYALLGRTPYIGYLGAESASDRERCLLLLKRLGIDELATRRLSTLSGGELQRAVLARALAQETPVLLLDEPTSALDLGRRIDVLELVDELRHER